jgi:hypothetical protein
MDVESHPLSSSQVQLKGKHRQADVSAQCNFIREEVEVQISIRTRIEQIIRIKTDLCPSVFAASVFCAFSLRTSSLRKVHEVCAPATKKFMRAVIW